MRICVFINDITNLYHKIYFELKYEQLIATVRFESKYRRRHQDLRYSIPFNKIQEISLPAIFLLCTRLFIYLDISRGDPLKQLRKEIVKFFICKNKRINNWSERAEREREREEQGELLRVG